MPNPTSSPFFPLNANGMISRLQPASTTQQRPGLFSWLGQQSGQAPISPSGQVSTQVSDTGILPPPPINPQILPAASQSTAIPPDIQDWYNRFKTWAQHDSFQNSWWQGWGGWFQGWNHPGGISTEIPNAATPAMPAVGAGISFTPAQGVDTSGPETPGMGQYIPTSSYMLTPAGQAGIRGLGSCGCGCSGGCGCNQTGMGTLGDGTGLMSSGLFNGQGFAGSGLFQGGFDPSTFGPAEWAALALGGYIIWSVVFATKAGIGYAQSVPGRTRRAARSVKSSFL